MFNEEQADLLLQFSAGKASLPVQNGWALINSIARANGSHVASIRIVSQPWVKGGRPTLLHSQPWLRKSEESTGSTYPLGQPHQLCQAGATDSARQLATASILIIAQSHARTSHIWSCVWNSSCWPHFPCPPLYSEALNHPSLPATESNAFTIQDFWRFSWEHGPVHETNADGATVFPNCLEKFSDSAESPGGDSK